MNNMTLFMQLFIFIAITTCNLLPQVTPEAQISHVVSTVNTIQTQEPVKLEQAISDLMIERDKQTIAQPSHLKKYRNRPHQSTDEFISSTNSLPCGPVQMALQTLIYKQPLLRNFPLTLHQTTTENGNVIACAVKASIVLYPLFQRQPDASKLFTLHHELQHHLYNDCNHGLDIQMHNRNHLSSLKRTAKVQSILENNTSDQQDETMLSILQKNELKTQKLILRVQERRADTQAMNTMQCPYCLHETAISSCSNNRKLDPKGYLRQWQFKPRINELKALGFLCLHHHGNGKRIDLSIKDSSTLASRLIIIRNLKPKPTIQSSPPPFR